MPLTRSRRGSALAGRPCGLCGLALGFGSSRIRDDAVLVAVGRLYRRKVAARRGLALDDELPKDCRHIELLNQSDFIELNGLKWTD